jgi:hypothetical protein
MRQTRKQLRRRPRIQRTVIREKDIEQVHFRWNNHHKLLSDHLSINTVALFKRNSRRGNGGWKVESEE